MGIQINGQTDTITAVDGSLTVSGAELPTVTNLNATGVVTTTKLTVGVGGTIITTTTDGNFGVGISSSSVPAAKFHVNGQAYINNTGASVNELTLNVSGTNYAHFYDSGGSENTLLLGGTASINTRPSSPIMAFGMSSGKVGIGLTNPASNLEVQSNWTSSASTNDIAIFARSLGAVSASVGYDDSNAGMYFGSKTNHALQLRTNNTERFRIGTSGQFGIGGATYGTSGQIMVSQGSSSAPIWRDGGKLVGFSASQDSTSYTSTSGSPYTVISISYTTKLASTASDILIFGAVAHGLGPAGTNLDSYGLQVLIQEAGANYPPGQYMDVFAGSGTGVGYGPEWDIRTTVISQKSSNVWSAGTTITYNLIADGDSTGGIFINRCTANTANRGTSYLTIMEIAK